MGMFAKPASMEEEMKKVESEVISSIIDNSMTVTGEITFKGKARIDGTINGNVTGEHLILSETGTITGDVTLTSFNCYGSLEGNVQADMITARKDCSIVGKIESGSITVEPGAAIQGEIKVSTKDLKLVDSKSTKPVEQQAAK